jgi:transposase
MERLSMRKIRERLRLRLEAGLSIRQVAASAQVARSSVAEYERRFHASGLSWPLPASLSELEFERRLFPPPLPRVADTRAVPDWAVIHRELRRAGVTLMLLWEEYRATHPTGVWLQLVLQGLRGLVGAGGRGHAPEPSRR